MNNSCRRGPGGVFQRICEHSQSESYWVAPSCRCVWWQGWYTPRSLAVHHGLCSSVVQRNQRIKTTPKCVYAVWVRPQCMCSRWMSAMNGFLCSVVSFVRSGNNCNQGPSFNRKRFWIAIPGRWFEGKLKPDMKLNYSNWKVSMVWKCVIICKSTPHLLEFGVFSSGNHPSRCQAVVMALVELIAHPRSILTQALPRESIPTARVYTELNRQRSFCRNVWKPH